MRRLELPTSTSRTWRAANCATPRVSIPYAELRCKGKYYFCISPRKTNVIFSLRFAYQGIKIKTPKVFDFQSFLCCLGRTRTLTNGTRIRCATITPQGNLFCFSSRFSYRVVLTSAKLWIIFGLCKYFQGFFAFLD